MYIHVHIGHVHVCAHIHYMHSTNAHYTCFLPIHICIHSIHITCTLTYIPPAYIHTITDHRLVWHTYIPYVHMHSHARTGTYTLVTCTYHMFTDTCVYIFLYRCHVCVYIMHFPHCWCYPPPIEQESQPQAQHRTPAPQGFDSQVSPLSMFTKKGIGIEIPLSCNIRRWTPRKKSNPGESPCL